MLDDDADDDGRPVGPPLPPEDRLWRHPSEMWASPAPARPAGAPRRGRIWPSLVVAGVCGAALATSVIALASGISAPEEEQRTSDLALSPLASAEAGAVQATPGLVGRIGQAVVHLIHRADRDDAWLGIEAVDVPADVTEERPDAVGAYVVGVLPDSPAAEAGLEAGDVVTHFDGHAVGSVQALVDRVDRSEPGQPVRLVVDRDGHPVELTARLATKHDS